MWFIVFSYREIQMLEIRERILQLGADRDETKRRMVRDFQKPKR